MEHRVSNMNNSLSRVAQEKMLLESDLRSLKSQRASLTPPPDVLLQRQKNSALGQYDREIARLENTLANLRERYRDSHPDVARIQSMLTVAQKAREKVEKDEQAAEKSASEAATAPVQRYDRSFDREIRSLDATIERIETQIKTKDAEAEDYRKGIQAAERQIRVIQTRIEAAPMSEQQYAEVVRDREVAKREYDEMNRKSSQSTIAEELERRQQGEMLELLNSASLPQSPTLPNRPMIIGGGAALGLVVGLALAGAREAKDTALKNLKDVRAYTQLTILGSVPLLENDLVVRRRKRLTWLAWSTACLVGILIMTGAVFYYMATNV
jgi:polysaccharide biosynthesis transport protein